MKYARTYDVSPDLQEDQLWTEFAEPAFGGIRENVVSICGYGFTEMVNNVIDHSGSPRVSLEIEVLVHELKLWVFDTGVGIFRKIRDARGLPDEHEAALELAKGKLTTDPERHTGEGIFFTARMFDSFVLLSGDIGLNFEAERDDYWIEGPGLKQGTGVCMEIAKDSERTTKEVFDRFTDRDFQIDKTVLVLRLFGEEGGRLVSRSQAKRLLRRLEQFRTVVLNFEGVTEVGPAFVDEIFRVFARAHPEIQLIPFKADDAVGQMVLRAVSRNGEQGPPLPPSK